ncbi:hypothetical protein SPHINGOAX6_10036 [Sphingomonas sp. AX6]|nr:hypothetical protein SPHINGOAX6_10036 [Sphingomonas sp. AX6]
MGVAGSNPVVPTNFINASTQAIGRADARSTPCDETTTLLLRIMVWDGIVPEREPCAEARFPVPASPRVA